MISCEQVLSRVALQVVQSAPRPRLDRRAMETR